MESITKQLNEIENYDNLVIATGTKPRTIDVDKKISDKVFYLRSIDDVLRIRDKIKQSNKVTIIGGGYIGLEMGSVWSRLGSEVHVVEFLDHITPGMDKEISKEFMKILKKQGINFHMETKVENIKKNINSIITSILSKSELSDDLLDGGDDPMLE